MSFLDEMSETRARVASWCSLTNRHCCGRDDDPSQVRGATEVISLHCSELSLAANMLLDHDFHPKLESLCAPTFPEGPAAKGGWE